MAGAPRLWRRVGTPEEGFAYLRVNGELVRILRMPEIQDRFRVQGMSSVPSTPEQFAALLKSESARYSKVVREAAIKAE